MGMPGSFLFIDPTILATNCIIFYNVVFIFSYGIEARLGFKTSDSRLNIKEGGRPEKVCVGFEDHLVNSDTIIVSLSLAPVEPLPSRLEHGIITLYTY